MVCTVIFMSNPTVVLCCVGVGVLTILVQKIESLNLDIEYYFKHYTITPAVAVNLIEIR